MYMVREPYLYKLQNLFLSADGARYALATFFVAASLLVYWLGGSVGSVLTKKIPQNPRYNFHCICFLLPHPHLYCYYCTFSCSYFCRGDLVLRACFALHKHPIHLVGEVGQDAVTLRKLLSNIASPYYNFCQLTVDSSGLVEKKHLFSMPSKASFWYCFIDSTLAGRIRLWNPVEWSSGWWQLLISRDLMASRFPCSQSPPAIYLWLQQMFLLV